MSLYRNFYFSSKFLLIFCCALFTTPSIADEVSVNYEKALQSFENKDTPATIIHLKNVFKEDKNNLPSLILYSRLLLKYNNGETAEETLNKVKSFGGDAFVTTPLLVKALLFQQKYNEALLVTLPLNAPDKQKSEIHVLHGQAYLGLKKFVPAEEHFDQALKLTPGYKPALIGKAQVYLANKLYAQANEFIDLALIGYNIPENAWIIKAQLQKIDANYDDALHTIEQCIQAYPEYLYARFIKAELLMLVGNYDSAQLEIDLVLDQVPKEPQINFLKALLASKQKNNKEVDDIVGNTLNTLTAIPEALLLENPRYLYLAGYLSFKQKKYEAARKYLLQYLAATNDPTITLLLARTYIELADYSSAIRSLKKVYRDLPNNPEVLQLLGLANQKNDNQTEAQDYLIASLELNPNQPETLFLLSESYLLDGKYSKAMEILNRLAAVMPESTRVLVLQNQSLVEAGKFPLALEKTQQLITVQPKSIDYLLLHFQNLLKLQDNKAANDILVKVIATSPLYLPANLAKIDFLITTKQYENALTFIAQIEEQFPDSVAIYLKKAEVFSLTGDKEQKLIWLEKALALEPSNNEALLAISSTYKDLGKQDKLQKLLEKLVLSHQTEIIYKLLADLYLANKDYPLAITTFQKYVDKAKNRGKALTELASIYTLTNDFDKAIQTLRQALLWNDDLIDTNIALVKLLLKNNDLIDAEKHIALISKKATDLPLVALLTGDLLSKQKKYQRALSSYQSAYKKSPSTQSLLSIYRMYKRLNKLDQAELFLEEHIAKVNPDDIKAVLALADIYNLQSKFTQSKDLYLKYLVQYPQSVILLNNLANVLLNLEDYEQAKIYALSAYKLSPKNVIVIDTLAWIHTKQNLHTDALKLYREALAIQSTNPTVKYHLAVSLSKLDRKTSAINYLADVIESNINFKERTEAINLIKSLSQ